MNIQNLTFKQLTKYLPIGIGIYLMLYSLGVFGNKEEVPPAGISSEVSTEETIEEDTVVLLSDKANIFIQQYSGQDIDTIYNASQELSPELQRIIYDKTDMRKNSLIGTQTYLKGTLMQESDNLLVFKTKEGTEWAVSLDMLDVDVEVAYKYRVEGVLYYQEKVGRYYIVAFKIERLKGE